MNEKRNGSSCKGMFWAPCSWTCKNQKQKTVDLQSLRPACSVQALDHPSHREEKKLKKEKRNGQCGKLQYGNIACSRVISFYLPSYLMMLQTNTNTML